MKTFAERLKYAMGESGLNQSTLLKELALPRLLSVSIFLVRTPPARSV